MKAPKPPHVMILGAGFAGLACARALGNKPVRVTIVDRNNYHLFVPLLYQVATAALSPADIAEPIRKIVRSFRNIEVVLGEVVGIDHTEKQVTLSRGQVLTYDRLVIATGSAYNYFGHDEFARFAPGMKTLANARRIRAQVLVGFELAEQTDSPEEQQRLMTTVVVGGGPTGVEFAGAVAELARHALARDFRRIDPAKARVLLVEAGPRMLSSFPDDLADYAKGRLEALGVEVLLSHSVDQVNAAGVVINGRFVPAHSVVWAAGIKASPAATWLGLTGDRTGRIEVAPNLAVVSREHVFAMGDTAACPGEDGKPLPGLAQVAAQQGTHLGKALARNLIAGDPVAPFRFRDRGDTAIVGRGAAIFDFGRHHLKGYPAWLLWAIVHIYLLVDLEKRFLVCSQWFWRYLTYARGARLILGDARDEAPDGGSGQGGVTKKKANANSA